MSQTNFAYILRRNPYRDSSLLLDCFTENQGRISTIARFSKRQSNRTKGMLEPFRLLDMRWMGSGEVLTLANAEEKRRYSLKGAALIQATYANELLLRATHQQQPIPELFTRYRQLLHQLETAAAMSELMLFELEILAANGYELNLWQDDDEGAAIQPGINYQFYAELGIVAIRDKLTPGQSELPLQQQSGVTIPGELLVALRYPENMETRHWQQLRSVLDRLLALLLNGKKLYARQLLT